MGTHLVYTTPDHAHTNSLCERYIGVLRVLLRAYTAGKQSEWEELLPMIQLAMNSARSETTGFSPNELVFGFNRHLPTSNSQEVPDADENSPQAFFQRVCANLLAAQDAIMQAQDKQAKYYNKKRSDVDIQKGDFVLVLHKALLDLAEKTSHSKSRHLYSGPFEVIDLPTPNTVKLLLPYGSRVHSVFHVDHVIKYHRNPAIFDSRPRPPEVSHDEQGNPLYIVESLIDRRKRKQFYQYKVRWLDWGEGYDTWEDERDLRRTVPEKVDSYDREHPKEPPSADNKPAPKEKLTKTVEGKQQGNKPPVKAATVVRNSAKEKSKTTHEETQQDVSRPKRAKKAAK
jgi:hypothetical protein